MKVVSKSIDLAGRVLSLEVGRLAQQATSAVLARYGDTVVLSTVVVGQEDSKKDYLPLSIEYQERLYAGGRIKGSRWVKREGRPTDAETLSARLIDRSIRPLFPKDFRREIQVIVTVLSADLVNDPDVLGIIATSAAVAISPLPWSGPVGAVRVGLTDGQPVTNPQNGNRTGVDLDLVVASTDRLINMIEAGARQIPEDQVLTALQAGFTTNQDIIGLINSLITEVGRDKLSLATSPPPAKLVAELEKLLRPKLEDYISNFADKEGGHLDNVIAQAAADLEDKDKTFLPVIVENLLKKLVRTNILDKSRRPDDRKFDQIRPLSSEVAVLPRVHGSAIFQRGQTQVLTVTTLGAPSLSQSLESAEGEETKRYMHHYNFPPYSVGETGRMGSPSRREIGHGALAERALAPVIPDESVFPYAIRVVSEVESSNGSTSMASACGSTLSLMDAGVPLTAPVAGISIGLVTPDSYPQKTDKFILLTDIIGLEDYYTDMDFKVAGTTTGITAIQLDVKVPGITLDICRQTLVYAKTARLQILEAILKVLPVSRPQLSPYAPKINTVQIPVDRIGELIGPGGKIIRKLMADTETTIDVRDDGSVFVSGLNQTGMDKALTWISSLGKEVTPGEIYEGTVVRIQPFGAFVNILPGKDGLVHVSQMDSNFVSDPRQVVKEGDTVKVWVTEIDPQGRVNLSMLFDPSGSPVVKAREDRPPSRPYSGGSFRGPSPRRSSGGFRDQGSRRRF
ncbi:polyribonucleotide nucleotidyltransferase [Candidatus Amesbacteria bacterium RIFCSPHIGHO2_12_FULL_48_14]|uniref:Polyribonucleotide nucleotidyltransferase n=1 Tax=Candidatus Amesbacteria bacterium RIFCSPHIGHO2_12_FULL_48_14 TaxID=1797257 RepID=A0A1F4ZCM5_9BACT|nr:MAG: polyribonucleotide nucleotidyltransferase [Candidatus Amesbacteria bacterium RIFCSPHIGHO2_12_FULL_48_14]